MDDYVPKESLYEVVNEPNTFTAFRCLLCSRTLSSKQHVLSHLNSAHGRSKYFVTSYIKKDASSGHTRSWIISLVYYSKLCLFFLNFSDKLPNTCLVQRAKSHFISIIRSCEENKKALLDRSNYTNSQTYPIFMASKQSLLQISPRTNQPPLKDFQVMMSKVI